jgi:hypothetical protein
VTRLQAGRPGFNSWQGDETFLFATTTRPALGPTQTPIQWVLGAPSPGVKWIGCETDHSPPYSVEVKNEWSYTSTPHVFMVWYLISTKDNFIFTSKVISDKCDSIQALILNNERDTFHCGKIVNIYVKSVFAIKRDNDVQGLIIQ